MSAIERLHGIPVTPSTQDAHQARRWRRHQLMAAGLDELSAHRIVTRSNIDLHALLDLADLTSHPAPTPDHRHG